MLKSVLCQAPGSHRECDRTSHSPVPPPAGFPSQPTREPPCCKSSQDRHDELGSWDHVPLLQTIFPSVLSTITATTWHCLALPETHPETRIPTSMTDCTPPPTRSIALFLSPSGEFKALPRLLPLFCFPSAWSRRRCTRTRGSHPHPVRLLPIPAHVSLLIATHWTLPSVMTSQIYRYTQDWIHSARIKIFSINLTKKWDFLHIENNRTQLRKIKATNTWRCIHVHGLEA